MPQAQLIVGSVAQDGTSRKPVLVDAAGHLLTAYSPPANTWTYGNSIILGTAANPVIPATPTDFWFLSGASNRTIRLLRVTLMGTATAAAALDIYGIKRSTADTAGGATFNPFTGAAFDSANPGTFGVVTYVTVANPSALGTAVGTITSTRLAIGAAAAPAIPLNPVIWDFGATAGGIGQLMVLRGVAESFCLNLNGQALPAGINISVTAVWTEE